jgi:tetratricopeptide (TPR) repeat protein
VLKVASKSKLAQLPDSAALNEYLRKAAALQLKFKDSEALAAYEAALKLSPQHYSGLWHAAVLSVSIGNRYSDETRKSAYFAAAHQYASRALALQPEAGESNYAMALALFSQAGLLSARDRLRIFKQLRAHVFLAAERRPDMPEAWQLLGRWYYRVAHYNVLEKMFSRVVLGGYPQGASSKKAMEAMEKARQLDPMRVQYCYDLARMYKYQGHRRRAIAVLQEAIKLPTYTSEDLTVNRLCQQLLPPLVRAASRRDRVHARWYERLHAGNKPAARE